MQTLLRYWRHRPSQRMVWSLAIPMVLSNLSVPLVALVDTAVIGHASNASGLGAVALGSSLYVMVVGVMGFLRMGTTGFSAQAYGQQNAPVLSQILYQALLLSLVLAALLAVMIWPLSHLLLAGLGTEQRFDTLTQTFFATRLLGLPAALANLALMGWFLGQHQARVPLAMMLSANLINAFACVLLVLYFAQDVSGAARAAVLGEYTALALGLYLARKPLLKPPPKLWQTLQRWAMWRPLLAVNRDIFLRSLALQSVFVLIAIQGARLGEITVAANLLLLNGLLITSYALDGLAHSLEALCGKAIGAKDRLGLNRALVVGGGWSLFISAGFSGFFYCFGVHFIDLQSNLSEVTDYAKQYLIYLAALPLVAVGSYVLDGLFIGATQAAPMRNAMLLALALALPVALALEGLGNHGLWLSFVFFMAARTLLMAVYAWRLTDQWYQP